MSLRDWFAGQALAGVMVATYREFLSKHPSGDCDQGATYEAAASMTAYAMADAMLAERAEREAT